MDTTPISKGVPDYLWDWAVKKKRLWAKLLVAKIVETGEALSAHDRQQVYDLYLREIGVLNASDPLSVSKPFFATESHELSLTSLFEVKGVNRLGAETPLQFGRNITVLYGGNGTGKTGYVRILKTLGQSYDAPTPILSDVLDDSSEDPSATIAYKLDGKVLEFAWSEEEACEDLSDISIFSNDCVQISIEAQRELLVTPAGFALFSILTGELDELARLNTQRMVEYETELGDWASALHEGTAVSEFIARFDPRVRFAEINEMAAFGADDAKELGKLQTNLSKLNKHLLEAERKTFNLQLADLKRAVASVVKANRILSQHALDKLVKNLRNLKRLKRQKTESFKDIAGRRGIGFYDSEAFQDFIAAAERYIEQLEEDPEYDGYPEMEDAVCIYCRQVLNEDDALELVRSYRRVLADDTEEQIAEATREIDEAVDAMLEADGNVSLHQLVFGEDEDGEPIQPAWLEEYNEKVASLLELVVSKKLSKLKDLQVNVPFGKTRRRLEAKVDKVRTAIAEKSEGIATLEEREAKLRGEIHELKDKKTLSQHSGEVKSLLRNLRTVAKLESKSGTLSTAGVSRQTTKARAELIAEDFEKNFLEEYDRFRRSHMPIRIGFKTDKGGSTLLQGVGSGHKLRDVLSEGEQKAIALAEFLTEVRMESVKAPVVFDDPVTSLDHHIIDAVARRLIEVSRERQVIVFTHSILLFNAVRQRESSPSYGDVEFVYYQVSRGEEVTGLLEKNPSSKEERFSYYKARINDEVFNRPDREKRLLATALAIKGYGLLRSAIEVLVEHEIFKGVVKRYTKNVSLMSLGRVDGKLIEEHKDDLNAIYERCCMYIEGHSNPDGVAGDADLALLKVDFEAVQKVRKAFARV